MNVDLTIRLVTNVLEQFRQQPSSPKWDYRVVPEYRGVSVVYGTGLNIQQAIAVKDKGPTKVSFNIGIPDYNDNLDLARLVASQLRQHGIEYFEPRHPFLN